MTAAAYNKVSGKRWQQLTTTADGSSLRQRQQRPRTMAVMAYNTKVTMAYIKGGRWQQPTMVAAVTYIDGRRRQWPHQRREGRGANAQAGEG